LRTGRRRSRRATFSSAFAAARVTNGSRPQAPPGGAMTTRAQTEYRYEKLTWPEINDAVELGKVCIVPCGAVEQHGPHLPLDVDLICPTEIARGAGRA